MKSFSQKWHYYENKILLFSIRPADFHTVFLLSWPSNFFLLLFILMRKISRKAPAWPFKLHSNCKLNMTTYVLRKQKLFLFFSGLFWGQKIFTSFFNLALLCKKLGYFSRFWQFSIVLMLIIMSFIISKAIKKYLPFSNNLLSCNSDGFRVSWCQAEPQIGCIFSN